MTEDIKILFHGLTLTFTCEVDADPGEERSWDSPGVAGWCYASQVWHDGKEIEPSEELQKTIDEALVEMYNERARDEGSP